MIKRYQEFIKETKESIEDIVNKYDIENYTINDDGSIDVIGDVNLSREQLSRIPFNFRKVSGFFSCSNNIELISLNGCPKEVGSNFYCHNNNLTSLKGCPSKVGGDFICSYNKLTSFKGCPNYIGGDFNCENNNIRDFYGFPDFWEGKLYILDNPVCEIYYLFNHDNRCTELLNTTRTIVNGDSIRIEGILDVADAMNIELPKNWKNQIKNYKLII